MIIVTTCKLEKSFESKEQDLVIGLLTLKYVENQVSTSVGLLSEI